MELVFVGQVKTRSRSSRIKTVCSKPDVDICSRPVGEAARLCENAGESLRQESRPHSTANERRSSSREWFWYSQILRESAQS